MKTPLLAVFGSILFAFLTPPAEALTVETGGAPPAPEIGVEQPAGNALTDMAGGVNFGSVAVGGSSTRTFTIKNTGNADLTGLGLSLFPAGPNEFSVTAAPTAPVPGPGGSTTFTITFAPTTAGPKSVFLQLASNDADETPFDIALTATALTRLEAWRLLYFGSIANSGNGADHNDFDRDGLKNILEFATLRDPTQPSPAIGVFTRTFLPEQLPPFS